MKQTPQTVEMLCGSTHWELQDFLCFKLSNKFLNVNIKERLSSSYKKKNRFHSSYIKGWIKSFVCIFDFSTLHGSREGEPQVKHKGGGEGKGLGGVGQPCFLIKCLLLFKDWFNIFVLLKKKQQKIDIYIFFFLSGVSFFGWAFFFFFLVVKR